MLILIKWKKKKKTSINKHPPQETAEGNSTKANRRNDVIRIREKKSVKSGKDRGKHDIKCCFFVNDFKNW